LHYLRQVLPDRGSPALIRSAAFLNSSRSIVPDERELVIVSHPKLKEEAERPTSRPRS
jgi:hypothetical protein